jgi:hypothetical protein
MGIRKQGGMATTRVRHPGLLQDYLACFDGDLATALVRHLPY